ncbi:MAG: 6-phosphogluconolactonase [Caldilineaceae bacterium]|nr:6-phosphogluconolactonase [Caldilineaceae bacterium]
MTGSNFERQSDSRGIVTGESEDLDKEQSLSLGAAYHRAGKVIVQPNRSEFGLAGAGMIAAVSLISIQERGAFNLALAGSSTPGLVYELLAEVPDIDWKRTCVFWSDERCVPLDHADSNYRMARETLLDLLPQSPRIVARMHVELPPEQAAGAYEETIREIVPAGESGIPLFDLILLGMGDDGHTASLFPGSEALNVTDRIVAADFVSKFSSYRLTFTYPLLNAGRHVLILVSGASKADTLNAVLKGPQRPKALPVQGVQPTKGQLKWLVDADAAQSIRN